MLKVLNIIYFPGVNLNHVNMIMQTNNPTKWLVLNNIFANYYSLTNGCRFYVSKLPGGGYRGSLQIITYNRSVTWNLDSQLVLEFCLNLEKNVKSVYCSEIRRDNWYNGGPGYPLDYTEIQNKKICRDCYVFR